MECPSCSYVAAPGQAAEQGVCPNCHRPYRDQPTPLNSDMAIRNIPEPGMEDSGGNPLQEGILGDYQNRGVRDESYASVKKSSEKYNEFGERCPHCKSPNLHINGYGGPDLQERLECSNCGWRGEPFIDSDKMTPETFGHPDPMMDNEPGSLTLPSNWASTEHKEDEKEPEFEVVDVLPPDPDSIRPDKKRMDKRADLLNTIEDVGAPLAGGAVGMLVGGPAGAALGAGLAGGAMDAAQGEGAGKAIGTGLEDAALGGAAGLGGAALAGGAGDAAAGAGASAVSGSAADAAASGVTRGGIGSLMKSAWSKIPTQRIRDAYLLNNLSGTAGEMMTPGQGQPNMMAQSPAVQPPSYYSKTAAPLETPTSQGHIPSNDTDDPEKVDFKERNDGDHETKGLNTIGINDIGGTDLGPDDFFSPDSGGLAAVADLLPKILQFALSDQSAAGDPDMEDLHSKLEAEKPGYMDAADDDAGEKLIIMLMKGTPDGEDGGDELLQDNDSPHDPIAEHEASALRPGLESICPACGSVMDASTGHCPQCGLGNARHQPQPTNPDFTTPEQMMQTTAAGVASQGPNTDEQKAAVAELLQQEGRSEEIPTMIMEPWNYSKELAQITGQEEPPEDIGQPGPPPPVTEPQQGEMPVPGMGGGSPTSAPMLAAIAKYAGTVDGICEACPQCGSHSTGYTDYEEGNAGCKSCGYTWKAKPLVEHSSATPHHDMGRGVPSIGGEYEDEPEPEPHGSHSWVDASGEPLQVGQTYKMYSENYDIPDTIKIDAVKPDVIEYTIVGEYGLDHRTELTHEEASLENLSFVPSEQEGEPVGEGDLEANFDDGDPRAGAGYEPTDSSTPHEMLAKTASPETVNIEPNWEGMRAWILNIARTDIATALKINAEMGSEGVTPEELSQASGVDPRTLYGFEDTQGEINELPETQPPMGHQGSIQETGPEWLKDDNDSSLGPSTANYEEAEDTGPAWLMEEVRTAGAKMSPWEQRSYIDEVGDARNADKLSLEGTHYEMNDLSDSFLWL